MTHAIGGEYPDKSPGTCGCGAAGFEALETRSGGHCAGANNTSKQFHQPSGLRGSPDIRKTYIS